MSENKNPLLFLLIFFVFLLYFYIMFIARSGKVREEINEF